LHQCPYRLSTDVPLSLAGLGLLLRVRGGKALAAATAAGVVFVAGRTAALESEMPVVDALGPLFEGVSGACGGESMSIAWTELWRSLVPVVLCLAGSRCLLSSSAVGSFIKTVRGNVVRRMIRVAQIAPIMMPATRMPTAAMIQSGEELPPRWSWFETLWGLVSAMLCSGSAYVESRL